MASSSENGHSLHNLLLFGRLLRRLGLDFHAGRMLEVVEVLEYIGVERKRDFRDALRTLLVHRQEDLSLFDEAFQGVLAPSEEGVDDHGPTFPGGSNGAIASPRWDHRRLAPTHRKKAAERLRPGRR